MNTTYTKQLRAVLANQTKTSAEMRAIDALIDQATGAIVAHCMRPAPAAMSPEAALMRRLDTCIYGGR